MLWLSTIECQHWDVCSNAAITWSDDNCLVNWVQSLHTQVKLCLELLTFANTFIRREWGGCLLETKNPKLGIIVFCWPFNLRMMVSITTHHGDAIKVHTFILLLAAKLICNCHRNYFISTDVAVLAGRNSSCCITFCEREFRWDKSGTKCHAHMRPHDRLGTSRLKEYGRGRTQSWLAELSTRQATLARLRYPTKHYRNWIQFTGHWARVVYQARWKGNLWLLALVLTCPVSAVLSVTKPGQVNVG